MLKRPVTPDDLVALERERADADRRYNEALTALDRALPGGPALPAPPAAPDDAQLPRLNEMWQVVADAVPPARGPAVEARPARLVARGAGVRAAAGVQLGARRSPEPEHGRAEVAAAEWTAAALRAVGDYAGALAVFHSHLIVVPAAGDALRRHEGPPRGRRPDGRLRAAPERDDRRHGEAVGVDGRARAALRPRGSPRSTAPTTTSAARWRRCSRRR